jgi:hypothetical protein
VIWASLRTTLTTTPPRPVAAETASTPAGKRPPRRLQAPRLSFLAGTACVAAVLTVWGLYLIPNRAGALALYLGGVAALVLIALAFEERPAVSPERPLGWLRRPAGSRGAAAEALAVLALLAVGLIVRLVAWPQLLPSGDSAEYDLAATLSAAAHHYLIVPWRTPGYSFTLFWAYTLAAAHHAVAVHAIQVVLSLLTAVLMAGTAYLATGHRVAALLALLGGCVLPPIAGASAYLMTECQAMFLASLVAFLVLAARRKRWTGAAILALGPALALLYETRTPMLPWVAVAAAVLPAVIGLAWRRWLVLALGATLTLAPVALVHFDSPYRAPTAGPILDFIPQALGTDRFSTYWNAPGSPALTEAYHAAIVADGAAAEFWSGQPPRKQPAIMAQRRTEMLDYVLNHRRQSAEVYVRRAPLFFRYDQQSDMSYGWAVDGALVRVMDGIVLLAAAGSLALALRREWTAFALLTGLVVGFNLAIPIVHVEPRYSLPALPTVAVLAAIGLEAAGRAVLGLLRRALWPGLAGSAALVGAVLVTVIAAEAWFWPGLVDTYAPRPARGVQEVAECYLGRHIITSVAWKPGSDTVFAGGVDGTTIWDVRSAGCPWYPTLDDIWDLSFTRDGTRVALGTYVARIVDSTNLAPEPGPTATTYLTGSGADVLGVSLDPSDRYLAFTGPAFGSVGIYDRTSRKVSSIAWPSQTPIAVRWSPDGALLAVSGARGLVELYDPTLSPVQTIQVGHPVEALAWSPAGDRLAGGDDDGLIHLWTVGGHGTDPAGAAGTVAGHRGAVRSLAFSPDGTRLASASSDHEAAIWDGHDLRPIDRLLGHTATVWGVSWSPDGSRLVTASADGSLKVWRAA